MGLPEWAVRVWQAAQHDMATGDELRSVFMTMRALGESLRALHDEQNGPPLIRRQRQWEEAMEAARWALRMYEEGPEEVVS